MRQLLARFILFVLILEIWTVVLSVFVHEGFHFTILEALGGKPVLEIARILWIIPIDGKVMFAEGAAAPEGPLWLFYVGPGLLTAFFMGVPIWLLAKITPEKGDVWIGAVGFGIIMVQGLYGLTELLLYAGNMDLSQLFTEWGEVPMPEFLSSFGEVKAFTIAKHTSLAVAMALFVTLRVKGIWRWLLAGEKIEKRQIKMKRPSGK